jgi:hypothetical protein
MVEMIASTSGGAMELERLLACYLLLGCPKIRMRSPNTRERKVDMFEYTDDAKGDKESPKDFSSLKSCESFYTCPRAPSLF